MGRPATVPLGKEFVSTELSRVCDNRRHTAQPFWGPHWGCACFSPPKAGRRLRANIGAGGPWQTGVVTAPSPGPPPPQSPVRIAIGTGLSAILLGAVSMALREPFLLPPMGATAFLLFFAPTMPASKPRAVLLGTAIALLFGYGSLILTGNAEVASAVSVGFDERRVLGCTLALAGTSTMMALLKAAHPPAGATTLVVALGLVREPKHLLVMEAGVALLLGLRWALSQAKPR